MEYMPLGNLRQAHNIDPFSLQETCEINYQSLSALAYLHQRNIGHRDVKPENMLVKVRDTTHLHIVLSDFGFSKEGTLQTYCGTKRYWPPEVEQQGPAYTKAVDIWSLGVVVLELAYSLPPRYAKKTWCWQIYQRACELATESLGNLLQDMLSIEPQKRPAAEECRIRASRLLTTAKAIPGTPIPTTGDPRTKSASEALLEDGQVTLVDSQYEVSLLTSLKLGDPTQIYLGFYEYACVIPSVYPFTTAISSMVSAYNPYYQAPGRILVSITALRPIHEYPEKEGRAARKRLEATCL